MLDNMIKYHFYNFSSKNNLQNVLLIYIKLAYLINNTLNYLLVCCFPAQLSWYLKLFLPSKTLNIIIQKIYLYRMNIIKDIK